MFTRNSQTIFPCGDEARAVKIWSFACRKKIVLFCLHAVTQPKVVRTVALLSALQQLQSMAVSIGNSHVNEFRLEVSAYELIVV